MSPRRSGVTLVELAVCMVLAGIVLAAVAGLLASEGALARGRSLRAELGEAMRIPAVVLPADVRALEPALDIRAVAMDSLALRVFRGTAVVCGVAGSQALVRYRGLRDPDPTKDSVLAVNLPGGERAFALGGVAAGGACTVAPGESAQRWSVPATLHLGTVLLTFESGGYYLSAGALRYRRGAGGRQPLTPTLLDRRGTLFGALTPVSLDVWLAGDSSALPPGLASRALRGQARLRIAFLNRGGG